MHVCLLGAPAVMQIRNPCAHLFQQPRRTQGWHRIVLAAARQSPNLCAADRAGTVSMTAAALRIDLVLYETTFKLNFVQRH
jgi:hypothetical protein